MNVLMALSQREVTGAEVYAVTIADELISRGHKVFVVSDTLTKPCKATYFPIPFNQRSYLSRLKQVRQVIKIIKDNDIQVVHAHSRASSWICSIACKIAKIPFISSTHGRQPVHLSRKINKSFGSCTICVCENIKEQIVNELNVNPAITELYRNPINDQDFLFQLSDKQGLGLEHFATIKVTLVGRLSGPKGDVAFEVLERIKDHSNIHINVVGGSELPEKFQKFLNYPNINFVGYVNNVPDFIKNSDVVIGAGRSAVEGLLMGRPTIAIGEALYEGLVTKDNIASALASNFGDINKVKETHFYYERLIDDIYHAVAMSSDELTHLFEVVQKEFSLNNIVDAIEHIYAREYVKTKHYEIPVIMYHRVASSEQEHGIHGTYIDKDKFINHLKYLKSRNYQTVTFEELANNKYKERFNKGNKWVILTFDDGYVDNYTTAFPLLKEYGFKAVIFLLSESKYNSWDADDKERPEKRFDLMNDEQIKEMMDYGIEFGIHTKNHPRLSQLPLSEAKEQIFESKAALEQRFNKKFITFAYPYGDLNEDVKRLVKESGVSFAVATDSGDVVFDKDLFQIRRIGIFPGNSMLTFMRKVSGRYNFIKMRREQKQAQKAAAKKQLEFITDSYLQPNLW